MTVLEEKYYFSEFFAGGARKLGEGLFRFGDRAVIDGALVNGSAKASGSCGFDASLADRFYLSLRICHGRWRARLPDLAVASISKERNKRDSICCSHSQFGFRSLVALPC